MAKTITPAPADDAGHNEEQSTTDRFTVPSQKGLQNRKELSATSANAAKARNADELPSFANGEFKVDQFRLSQNFTELAPVVKSITVVPVRKPSKESFIRTFPDEIQWFPACLIELKETSESYLIARELWSELSTESTFVTKLLVPAVTRQGALILWPIRLPGSDGRLDDWNKSALEAARIAKTDWIRLASNRPLGAYDTYRAGGNYSEPVWPKLSVEQMVKIAFKDKVILSSEHPVIEGLRGLV